MQKIYTKFFTIYILNILTIYCYFLTARSSRAASVLVKYDWTLLLRVCTSHQKLMQLQLFKQYDTCLDTCSIRCKEIFLGPYFRSQSPNWLLLIGFGAAQPILPKSNSLLGRPNRLLLLGDLGSLSYFNYFFNKHLL